LEQGEIIMSCKLILTLALSLMVLTAVGCSSGSNTSSADSQPAAEENPIPVPIPANSIFTKIKIGMDQQQVYALLGPPTSSGAYVTGKAWIPFYYGGDKTRTIARYKGEGYIIFSQNNSFSSTYNVQSIHYDANETGFES
jgi:hypothetical protein